MKKMISILLVLILGTFVAICSTSMPYARKCKVCLEDSKNRPDRFISIGIAHRDFETPIVYKDGKAYATYKCCYGHKYLICLAEE